MSTFLQTLCSIRMARTSVCFKWELLVRARGKYALLENCTFALLSRFPSPKETLGLVVDKGITPNLPVGEAWSFRLEVPLFNVDPRSVPAKDPGDFVGTVLGRCSYNVL